MATPVYNVASSLLTYIQTFIINLFSLTFQNASSQSHFMPQYFLRVCAASDFAFVFLAWYAPCFLRDEDRKLFFISQLAVSCCDNISQNLMFIQSQVTVNCVTTEEILYTLIKNRINLRSTNNTCMQHKKVASCYSKNLGICR